MFCFVLSLLTVITFIVERICTCSSFARAAGDIHLPERRRLCLATGLIRHAPSNSRLCIISRCFYCMWGLIKVAKQKPQPTIMKGYLARYISIQLTRDLYSFDIQLVHLIRHKYLRNSIFYQVPCLYDLYDARLCYSLTNEILNASFSFITFYIVKYRWKKKTLMLRSMFYFVETLFTVDSTSDDITCLKGRSILASRKLGATSYIAFLFLINGRNQCFWRIAFSTLWHHSECLFLAKFCRLETLRGKMTAFRNYFNNCKI